MKRMLFNATQAEELRVAIVDGQKLVDLDIESASKEQRKSNIYKAVITRIEPSLEAAFVDYGTERHGFLPFKEVSRSYFKAGVEVSKARIQDALSVGQELIIQVEKDERGNKGAALTTYISLAGRYLVLMPNNPRGGGVSRRIEGEDRQELREVMDQLEVPAGASLIARTAGIGRSAEELQWDLNYLAQLWEAIDGAAKAQSGAFLIYQESSLVIRAIRDYFHAEIGEILIDTDDVFEQAQQFMAHVMPAYVSRVKRYQDDVPLFSRFQIEHQIESAYSRQVNLPSGGAIVIDHTEALVSVDVNSGRATKGSDIEETAFRTNCEAADEIARQLRLRDLGGLIVIDFIDMESAKNQREVENRLRDALHHDRARVQTGKISRFGLLELSRQRLRPALAETSYITCPRCTGTGHIRSTESAALHILRILEEESMKENTGALHCQVPVDVGTFLLNEKRVDISHIESRHRVSLIIIPNRHLETPAHEITRVRHEQLNSEGTSTLASYQMATAPATETYQTPSAQAEGKAIKVEAAVRGITPDHPAPIVEARAEAPAAPTPADSGGLFGKIVGFFLGEKKAEPPLAVQETSDKPRPRRDGRERNRDASRGRERNGRRDGSERKERPESRPESRSSGAREEGLGEDNSRRSRSKPGEPREARETTEPREPRPPRQPRPPRPPRAEAAVATADAAPIAVSPAPTFGEEANPARGADGEARSGRRNRGGRGRGRGERREDSPATLQDDNAPTVTPLEVTPAEPTLVSATEQQPLPPVESITSLPVVPPAAVSVSETRATPTASGVAEPATFAAPQPLPAAVPVAAAPIEPVFAPAPVPPVAVATPRPALEDMGATLQQAGLVMIQTTTGTPAPTVASTPGQPLGRKPRPAPVIAAEPLQMVETHHDQ
ncbi:MAG: ribonuclease E/G [Betaproteobacteria bacterium HGW-Betaproteobacteria-11]|nr:MAG: ribonuclease E/G [Betaproteobacteria bacterium HGW-Betaproteobacteria-11]